MRILSIILFTLLSSFGYSQNYGNKLASEIQSKYNLTAVSFPFGSDESVINETAYYYGNAGQAALAIHNDGFSFEEEVVIDVSQAGVNAWDSGFGIKNTEAVSKGDIVLLSFYAKREVDSGSDLSFFAEDAATFDKEFLINVQLTDDWKQYLIPFEAKKDYGIDELAFGIHLAAIAQQFYLGGWMALNFENNHTLEEMPNSFTPGSYAGSDPNAGWRIEAENYIEENRKIGISIVAMTNDNSTVANVPVKIEMLAHDFGFGSAFVTCRMPGNNCYDPTYVEKLSNLDGKGHGFNVGVTENGLKWDAWEEEWISTPAEAVSAIQYLADQGIEMRGHTLFWPGYEMMPEDIFANRSNLSRIRDRISARIGTMINHPQLKNLIREWDVFNELAVNRDFEEMFKQDPNFETGREIYLEIINQIREIDPELKVYLNDYIVLSGGGSAPGVVDFYKSIIQELISSDTKIDGIGFQCHIGTQPTSILKMRQTFTDFAEMVGPNLSITEYDIEADVPEDVQAQYMNDILLASFGHPAINSFIMWGFWDDNHWKNNAPIFRSDWSIKPSGQIFIDKVFKEWWTDVDQLTDENGQVNIMGFKGKYRITVGSGDQAQVQEFDLTDYFDYTFTVDMTTATEEVLTEGFKIYPNPLVGDLLTVELPEGISKADIIVYDILGKRIQTHHSLSTNAQLPISVSDGTYFIKAYADHKVFVQKLIVQN